MKFSKHSTKEVTKHPLICLKLSFRLPIKFLSWHENQSFQHGRSVSYTLTRVCSLVAAFSTMFNDSPAGRCHRCRLNYRAINSDCRNNSWHFSYPTCSLLNPFFCRPDRPPQKRKFVVHLVTAPHLRPAWIPSPGSRPGCWERQQLWMEIYFTVFWLAVLLRPPDFDALAATALQQQRDPD